MFSLNEITFSDGLRPLQNTFLFEISIESVIPAQAGIYSYLA